MKNLSRKERGLLWGEGMDPSEAARKAEERRAKVRAENEAASRLAQEAERRARAQLVAIQEEEEVKRKEGEAKRLKQLEWTESLKNAVLVDVAIPPVLLLHVMSFLPGEELLRMSATCKWARARCESLFEQAFARDKSGVWLSREPNWSMRYFKATHHENLREAFRVAADFDSILLSPGTYWCYEPFWVKKRVHFEGVGFNWNVERIVRLSRDAESIDAVEMHQPNYSPNIQLLMHRDNGSLFYCESPGFKMSNLSLKLGKSEDASRHAALVVQARGSCSLRNVLVESLQHSALYINKNGSLQGHGCSFRSDDAHGIQVQTGGNLQLESSLVLRSKNTGIECLGGSTMKLESCILAGNAHNGISMVDDDQGSFSRQSSSLVMRDCSVFDNGLYGLEALSGVKLHFQNTRFSRNMVGMVIAEQSTSGARVYENWTEDIQVRSESVSLNQLAERAVKEANACIVSLTGPHYVSMDKYGCETCGLTGFYLLCKPCADHHILAGHDVVFRDRGSGFCDCMFHEGSDHPCPSKKKKKK